jgi:hypothetical protein
MWTEGPTDRQADMEKLIVALFAILRKPPRLENKSAVVSDKIIAPKFYNYRVIQKIILNTFTSVSHSTLNSTRTPGTHQIAVLPLIFSHTLALKSFMHFRHQGAPVLILANLVFYHS